MIITTDSFLMGYSPLHSNKTNKDYYKINFVVEGNFTSFIVSKDVGENIVKQKIFANVASTHQPQNCKIDLQIDFGERGVFTSLLGVK